MMIINESTFWSTMIFASLISIGIGVLCTILGQDVYRRGRKRIVFYDPDSGSVEIRFVKTSGNEFTTGKAEKAKRYILEAAGKLSGVPATWIIHPRHGWNFIAKGDAESVHADSLLYKLAVSNPKAYHMAIAQNRARDALNANAKDDKYAWVPMAVFGAIIALLIIMGTLGFVAYKIVNVGAAPPGV
jgi:hypothetical protein